jgi:hypothetical protein
MAGFRVETRILATAGQILLATVLLMRDRTARTLPEGISVLEILEERTGLIEPADPDSGFVPIEYMLRLGSQPFFRTGSVPHVAGRRLRITGDWVFEVNNQPKNGARINAANVLLGPDDSLQVKLVKPTDAVEIV